MNRFSKKFSIKNQLKRINLPVLGFILLLIVFLYGVSSVSATTTAKQLESLENAVYKSIVQCYAIEGMYPPNLIYLEEHYGLVYDEKSYFIDYQPIASNLMPDVTILARSTTE
ncbi:MAG: hypothetical protein PHT89_05705 [Lachnospiraceae bacterium]|nr:hypothetical protein [Lachnospiraceae bacterium]MDD3660205.1 hypothetical protein [Lachnospiraceae bacterium]